MLATAALAAAPSTSAFMPTSSPTLSTPTTSVTRLDARRRPPNNSSRADDAIDRLISKRMAIKQRASSTANPIPEEIERRTPHEESVPVYMGDGLEYLYDVKSERDIDDPFHVILLGSTFRKNHEMSNQYIVANFGRILGYSQEQSLDATTFARHQGFSNLGTWTRDECLNIGNQLRFQGFECRIVPVTSDDEGEELGNGFDDWATEEWGSETVAHC